MILNRLTLTYFPLWARGPSCALALSHANLPFSIDIPHNWPALKPTTDFSKLPFMTIQEQGETPLEALHPGSSREGGQEEKELRQIWTKLNYLLNSRNPNPFPPFLPPLGTPKTMTISHELAILSYIARQVPRMGGEVSPVPTKDGTDDCTYYVTMGCSYDDYCYCYSLQSIVNLSDGTWTVMY